MRLIDADELLNELTGVEVMWWPEGNYTNYDDTTIAEIINNLPTIEAVPVVHGNKMQDFNNDLIRRTDALNMVHNFFLSKIKTVSGDREEIPMGELNPILKDNKELSVKIKSIPNFEAVPVVHGKWTKIYGSCMYVFSFRCSECNKLVEFDTNFCPNCGADMRTKGIKI